METIKTFCTVCSEEKDCRFLPLFVTGSEGTHVCHSCEMNIVEFVRGMIRLSSKSRKHGYSMAKKVRESKDK